MKLISARVTNFGSYKNLSFNLSNLGLTLIYGATGSGKSTLQDIVPWILGGVTAKDGAVDEVRSWTAQDEATTGTLRIKNLDKTITVVRIRGTGHQNDLYWYSGDDIDKKQRGKDLPDTQRLLNAHLGVDADFYCTATYFNEFSESNLFFLAKAKDKRKLFEKLTPLDLPISVAEKIVIAKKQVKCTIDSINKEYSNLSGRLSQLIEFETNLQRRWFKWSHDQQALIEDLTLRSKFYLAEQQTKIEALKTKSYRFEEDKKKKIDDLVDKLDALDQKITPFDLLEARIDALQKKLSAFSSPCQTCGSPRGYNKELEDLKEKKVKNNHYIERFSDFSAKLIDIQDAKNPYTEQIAAEKQASNHYEVSLNAERAKVNPYYGQITETAANIGDTKKGLAEHKLALKAAEHKFASLVHLYNLSFELRSILLKNVIKKIQNNTNSYLETYFDSEFKVDFELDGGDGLAVNISKNSYPCSYRQLSKGQKQLLKLCFSVSVMKAATDNLGISFNLLCFDEALDGMDSDLKVKSYSLFSALEKEYESILLIDHTPEFQSLFSNKFKVLMIGDESTIEAE